MPCSQNLQNTPHCQQKGLYYLARPSADSRQTGALLLAFLALGGAESACHLNSHHLHTAAGSYSVIYMYVLSVQAYEFWGRGGGGLND